MDNKLLVLTQFKFKHVGRWLHNGRGLECQLDPEVSAKCNIIYAFSVDDDLTYIGMTTMAFCERMRRYAHPPKFGTNGGGTNIKNNRQLLAALSAGKRVDIYAFIDAFTAEECALHTKPLHGLERSIIELLSPPWNGRPSLPDEGAQIVPIRPLAPKLAPGAAGVTFEG